MTSTEKMDALPLMAAPIADTEMKRIVWASVLGTVVEWYDFLIYGSAAALVFNKLFFPSLDPVAGQLAAFAALAVGFVARPLGGALFGHFGDRLGRKAMLTMTMLIMGGGTFLIGCLPTYSQIGLWAPVLLVALRLFQGIGIGGEWGGAVLMVIEHAPADKRGLLRQPGADRVSGGRRRFDRDLPVAHDTARSRLPVMGLAIAVPREHHPCGRRRLHPAAARGNAGVRAGQAGPEGGKGAVA